MITYTSKYKDSNSRFYVILVKFDNEYSNSYDIINVYID
jgi:hypothetical protein